MSYSEKLKNPKWDKFRSDYTEHFKIRENSEKVFCEWCLNEDDEIHLHHIRYKKGGGPWDSDFEDVMFLCRQCHKKYHEFKEEALLLLDEILVDYNKANSFMNILYLCAKTENYMSGQIQILIERIFQICELGLGNNYSKIDYLINRKEID